jgi:hypothetical protein
MSTIATPIPRGPQVHVTPALIEDARRRQRKRRLLLAATGIALVASSGVIYGSHGGTGHLSPTSAITHGLPGASVSSRQPTLAGVESALTCPTCDGEPLTYARRPLARQMETEIRRDLAAGWTRGPDPERIRGRARAASAARSCRAPLIAPNASRASPGSEEPGPGLDFGPPWHGRYSPLSC